MVWKKFIQTPRWKRSQKMISHSVCFLGPSWLFMSRGGHGCWSVSLRFRISRFPGGRLETDRYHTSALQVHENECKHVVFHGISNRMLVTPGLCTLGEQSWEDSHIRSPYENAVVARISSGIPRKLLSFPKIPPPQKMAKKMISHHFRVCPGPLWVYF